MMYGSRLVVAAAFGMRRVTWKIMPPSCFTLVRAAAPRVQSFSTSSSSNSHDSNDRTTTIYNNDENDSDLLVGIFVDLDNVAPAEYTRATAARFVQPLRRFGKDSLDGKVDRLMGWGNSNTHSFGGKLEDDFLQTVEYEAWDGNSAVTGYDESGILRCGVCGRKINISKKDRQKGLTPERKLQNHIKELHGREQSKRLNRRKQQKLPTKEYERMRKYKSAVVGVMRQSVHINDLFQVLREQGMRCKLVNDVDQALERTALSWINQVSKDNQTAAVIVVSRDSDFVPVLEQARAKNVLAVSVSPNASEQTKALVKVSDIVLEARSEEDMQDDDIDLDKESVDAVYKVTSLSSQGQEALRRGYVKKVTDSFEEKEKL